jgi:hypothetical protein
METDAPPKSGVSIEKSNTGKRKTNHLIKYPNRYRRKADKIPTRERVTIKDRSPPFHTKMIGISREKRRIGHLQDIFPIRIIRFPSGFYTL